MDRMKKFLQTTLIGGLVVVLPVAILIALILWLAGFVSDIVRPLTNLLLNQTTIDQVMVANVIAIAIILGFCFFVGIMVRISIGRMLFNVLETRLLKAIPGYNIIKETIVQLLDSQSQPFSKVALANIFGNETMVTAFVTDEHEDGSYSVFVPTGPNPTSGNIYHLKPEYVHLVDVSVEDAMRSIISCGAGSTALIRNFKKQ